MTDRAINPETGEITETAAAEMVPADEASRYAALADEASALRQRLRERAIELHDSDEDTLVIEARMMELEAESEAIKDRWREVFEYAQPGTSIDAPRVKVTKPMPRTTWKLDKTAKEIASGYGRNELANLIYALRDHQPHQVAAAIIAWLNPHSKTGAQPDIRITVRAPKQ